MNKTNFLLKLKRKSIFFSFILFSMILSIGIYNNYKYNLLLSEFKNNFNDYKFSEANNILLTKEIFNPVKSVFLTKDLDNYFSSKLDSISYGLTNYSISQEDALAMIKEINRYSILSKNDILCVSNLISIDDNSESNFNNGIQYFNDCNYNEALNSLKKVSPLDLNYDESLIYIDKCKSYIKENLFALCDDLASKDYYSKAINLLTDNLSLIGDDYDVTNKISELKIQLQNYYDKTSEIAEASSSALTSEISPNNINTLNIESNTPYFINVSIENQKTYVYQGTSDNWRLVRTCPCSTGIEEEPTPCGSFTTQEKGSWFFSEKYNQGGKYWTQITGDILFHSVPYSKDKTTVIDYTLNEPASHGCIRLSLDDAKWIYSNVPKGSKIIIK